MKVKYFLYFIIDLLKDLLKGEKVWAESDVIQERGKTCSDCPMASKGVCMACGCFIRYKKQFRASTCPMGMWRK